MTEMLTVLACAVAVTVLALVLFAVIARRAERRRAETLADAIRQAARRHDACGCAVCRNGAAPWVLHERVPAFVPRQD